MPIDVDREKVKVWRALKLLTKKGSEARKIVTSARGENGFEAWQMLSQAFEPYEAGIGNSSNMNDKCKSHGLETVKLV